MRLRSCLAALALFSAAHAAYAESFQFTFGSAASTFSGSGLLTIGDPVAPGEYLISEISGTARLTPNGPLLNIASLLAPGAFPSSTNGGTFPANDNYLFVLNNVGRPDENGFSFLVDGGAQINLYNDGTGTNALLLLSGATRPLAETAALSISPAAATPEPSSLLLLCTGMLGCALGRKRRHA